ncbi:MAG: ribonuclease catalytic domain-containing protein [Lentisphaeria bacterium]|jgi:exoribonuclease-2
MDFLERTVVDYLGNNEMCLGVVVKGGTDRVQVRGATQQQDKVKVANIVAEHGMVQGDDVLGKLAAVQSAIRDAMAEVDLELLWEDVLAHGCEPDLPALAAHYFGEATAVQTSALARQLIEDGTLFQRKQLQFTPRTPEEIEELKRLRALRAERAAAKERTRQWLDSVLEHSGDAPAPVPEEQEGFLRLATDYLLCGFNSDAVNILSAAREKSNAREVALRLLRVTRRMPEGVDEFLLANGIHAGFSDAVLEHADSLSPYAGNSHREDLSALELFSIDDEETREIDDALSCSRDEAQNYLVGIHLADPACFVSKDDVLDAAAVERPLSLYLPTTTVMMFPERVGCDLASLVAGELRPALSFQVKFSPEGALLDWRFIPSAVRVRHRLDYRRADELLAAAEGDSVAGALQALLFLAGKLRAGREAAGAVQLNGPELKIRVRDDVVTVTPEDFDSPSHQLVSEFMILANHLAAKYALRHDLPVIYRMQEQPASPVSSVKEYNPYLFEQQVKKMKRTRLTTYPQAHFGLGLDLYTQISSPLRRYADLVIQRQLSAHFLGKELPYTREELFGVLDNVERTASQNRSLEREANKYWLLEYLRREKLGAEVGATIVRVEGSLVLAELDGFAERGVVMTRNRMTPGEHVQLRIRDAIPKAGRLVLEPLAEG